ncbi:MAG: site-2 protease family protein [Myxococcota bacterium]
MPERPEVPAQPEAEQQITDRHHATRSSWIVPLLLIALTFASTLFVGAQMVLERPPESTLELLQGWVFSVPLMAILMSHEFGHYFAGRYHRIDLSLPYFIPVPFFLLGTMGAVIRMRGAIRSRAALLDVGAAGPLAGLLVALPVVIWGIDQSEVRALSGTVGPMETYLIEGHSMIYAGLIYWLKGPIPAGHDIWLTPTALAGWAGLLVTMINLVPVGQLDGGHIAYALFGEVQNRYSSYTRRFLVLLGLGVGMFFALQDESGTLDGWLASFSAGFHWIFWAGLLWIMARFSGSEHPPTRDEPLDRTRRGFAWLCLVLFVLLFMPSWIRIGTWEAIAEF